MKKLLMTLIALPMLMMSCNDEMALSEETVEVSFEAEIPAFVGTRAGDGLTVNKLVCAVFEKNGPEIKEIKGHRTTLDVNSASGITYSPRLVKGRTYQVVFWAMRDDNYNVTNMARITRATGSAEADYDAFTATVETKVDNSTSVTVALTRPLAQLNMGVTPEDWDGVASVSTFNMTPTNITISLTGKDTFNALTGLATGEDKSISYNLPVSGREFTVDEKIYKNIAMCYVLPDAQKENFDITYSIYDRNSKAIRSDVEINAVPLQANYKTNVVGGLLTGTVTYNVSIEQDFSSGENNKEI